MPHVDFYRNRFGYELQGLFMNSLLLLFQQFTDYSKSNPTLAAALGLYVAGLTTFVFRSVPKQLWETFCRQVTTSLTINNSGQGRAEENFDAFSAWFHARKGAHLARAYQLDGSHVGDHGSQLSIGNGVNTYFFWQGRLFWMTRRMLEKQQGSYRPQYEITITMLGRSRKTIVEMIENFRWKPDPTKVNAFMWSKTYWERVATTNIRPLNTVIMDPLVKADIIRQIEFFRANAAWYHNRGLSHKKTFILHGVPGTGKTSIIKALAGHYGMNVATINLTSMSDESFAQAMASVPDNTVVLIEDFDSAGSTHRRKSPPKPMDATHGSADWAAKSTAVIESVRKNGDGILRALDAPTTVEDEKPFTLLTLAGVLNTLDGIIGLDNQIVFMTTNHLEKIDPALVRKGRVDHIYEVKPLTHPQVVEYIQVVFPETLAEKAPLWKTFHFHDILGCDLQAIYMEHSDDPDEFMLAIPHVTNVSDLPVLETPPRYQAAS